MYPHFTVHDDLKDLPQLLLLLIWSLKNDRQTPTAPVVYLDYRDYSDRSLRVHTPLPSQPTPSIGFAQHTTLSMFG